MSSTSAHRLPLLPRVEPFRQSRTGRLLLTVAASLLVAICAHVSFPMPFTPVPTTLQPFAVILVGMLLGPAGGFAALTLYLLEGASSLPVFTPQGPGGIAQLLGPTAGYLFSYPLAAALAGAAVRLFRRWIPVFPSALFAASLALLPIFSMGALWLGHLLRLNSTQTVHLAVTPFLGAEIVKLFAAAAAYSAIHLTRRS